MFVSRRLFRRFADRTVRQAISAGPALPLIVAATLTGGLVFAPVAEAQQQTPPPAPPFPENENKTPPVKDAPPVTPGKVDANALPGPLTLAQAIELALQLQPDVAVSVANRQSSEQRLRQAQARYFPTVTPQYQYLNNYTFGTVNQFVGGSQGTIPVQTGSTRETRQANLNLNYRLYDSGTRDLNARQARQTLRAQTFGEANVRQSVIADVANNYFTTLRNTALVQVSTAQVARARNTLEVVRAQVEVGTSPRKDVFQAEADLLNAEVNLLQAQNNAEIAQAQLKNAIGVVGGGRLALADVPVPSASTPVTALGSEAGTVSASDTTINQLAETAYRNRPDIAQSQQNVEANQTAVGLSQINSRVIITSDFNAGSQFDTSTLDRSLGRNRQLNLAVSYPLFDAGLARAQVNASRATARSAEAQLTGLRQQVAVEVEQAFRTLSQARAILPASEAAQRAAQINYEAAIESRREGVGSIVDVITAQTLLVQAQTNYVQAVYNFYSADAQLARAVGQADRIATSPVATGTATGPPAGALLIPPPLPAPTTP